MRIDESIADGFARAALGTYDLSGLGINEDLARGAIKTEFLGRFEKLNKEDARVRRCEGCGIAGSTPADFAEHLVHLGEGQDVVCGIRHLGMNLDKPFVSIWPNFAPRIAEEMREIYAAELANRFAVFKPKWIQISTPTGEESEAEGSVYVVARARDVSKLQKWPGEDDLEFEVPESEAYFDWYQDCYDRFHEDFPSMKDWVTINDRSLMEDCRGAGLLRLAKMGGRKVGLIAAARDDFLGHAGMYLVEILLEREWRGKGLAKALQRRFVNEVCEPEDFVWGAIDRANAPSLRTALANGRRVVRGECFLRFT